MSDIYSARDVCDRWGISRNTLTRWVRYGIPYVMDDVPHMRIGVKLAFSSEQVAEIERHMRNEVAVWV